MRKPKEFEIQFEYQYVPPTPEREAAYEEAFDMIVDMIVDMIIEDWLEENKTLSNETQELKIVES